MEEIVKSNSMKDYYTHRKIIQNLYKNDVMYSGDLAGALLGLREQNRYIESMSLEIQSGRIRIELITPKDENENKEIFHNIPGIYQKIAVIIDGFISANIFKITDPSTASVISNNIANGWRYYDINHVGNMINIFL